jgi:hypothetical protein
MRGRKRDEMYDKSEAEIGGRRYTKYVQRYLTERRLFRWQEWWREGATGRSFGGVIFGT